MSSVDPAVVSPLQSMYPQPLEPTDLSEEEQWQKYFNFDDATSEHLQENASIEQFEPFAQSPTLPTTPIGVAGAGDDSQLTEAIIPLDGSKGPKVISNSKVVPVVEALHNRASSPTYVDQYNGTALDIKPGHVASAPILASRELYTPHVSVPPLPQTPYPIGGPSRQYQPLPRFIDPRYLLTAIPGPRLYRPLPPRSLAGIKTHSLGVPSSVVPTTHLNMHSGPSIVLQGVYNIPYTSSAYAPPSGEVMSSALPNHLPRIAVLNNESTARQNRPVKPPVANGSKLSPEDAARLKALQSLTFDDVVPGLSERWQRCQYPNRKRKSRSDEGEEPLTLDSGSIASGSSSLLQYSDERPAKTRKIKRGAC